MRLMFLLLSQMLGQRLTRLVSDFLMHLAVYMYSMFVTWIYITAKLHNYDHDFLELGVLMIVLMPVFVVMRGDFFVHRSETCEYDLAQTFISSTKLSLLQAVPGVKTAEQWKSRRKNTWMVGLMDYVASIFLLVLLYKMEMPLWYQGEHIFVMATVATVPVVAICAGFIPKLAGK